MTACTRADDAVILTKRSEEGSRDPSIQLSLKPLDEAVLTSSKIIWKVRYVVPIGTPSSRAQDDIGGGMVDKRF